MGGWISLVLARSMGSRVAGLIGIAAAPDFTEDSMWAGFDAAQRDTLARDGVVFLPSDYGDPYPISKVLIEESRASLVMRDPLQFDFPVRLFQGTKDTAVTRDTALALLDHIEAADLQLTFKQGADHSFSSPECLDLLTAAIEGIAPPV
jgi:pimeloyl-ACP methyl ester carboxylesterase